MIAYLQQYVLYILGGVIVLLLIFGGVQTVRLKLAVATLTATQARLETTENQIVIQNESVKQLFIKGEEYNEAIKKAIASIKPPKIIKLPATPTNCEDAAKWALDMVKEFE
jgi:hypothetical protein